MNSEGYSNNITPPNNEKQIGQDKCPKCGSTDIILNSKTGKLRCNFCRCEFDPVLVEETSIESLSGETLSAGAQDINNVAPSIMTIKCQSCGAEVVIDTSTSTQARCHWCRSFLSVKTQIPNGSVPDVVLPFKITKEEAQKEINAFVKKRQFFAHPEFKKEFTTENIMGVYFPYMLVDINSHANLAGQGEHLTRQYSNGDNNIRYEADLYAVEREFDLAIDDLTIESSKDKLDNNNAKKTNNVINAIMPFDTENCVKWNANYLRGYTSEKRDTNLDVLKPIVETQAKDIARFKANDSLTFYDRGVAWAKEDVDILGISWKSAYLPVWLYSYQEKKKGMLHYVAVNARTKEAMGSVPIHYPKLILISFLIEIICILAMFFVDWDYSYLFLLGGFIYFFTYYFKYRNKDARHHYEVETKANLTNLRKSDTFIDHRRNLANSQIVGANNKKVLGSTVKDNEILETLNNMTKL